MVLQQIDMQNNNNNTFCKKPTEEELEQHMMAQIWRILPEVYNLPKDITQYELIMATIQYINTLQSLTAQYH